MPVAPVAPRLRVGRLVLRRPAAGGASPLLSLDASDLDATTAGALGLSGSGQRAEFAPLLGATAASPSSRSAWAWIRPTAMAPGTTGEESATAYAECATSSGVSCEVPVLDVLPDGTPRCVARTSAAELSIALGTAGQIQVGQPHLLVGMLDAASGRARLWVDGVQATPGAAVAFGAVTPVHTLIGARTAGSTTRTRHFIGAIEGVGAAPVAMDDDLADWLFNGGLGRSYAEQLDAIGPALRFVPLHHRAGLAPRIFGLAASGTLVGSPARAASITGHRHPSLHLDAVDRLVDATGRSFDAASGLAVAEVDPVQVRASLSVGSSLATAGATLMGRTDCDLWLSGNFAPSTVVYSETSADGWQLDLGFDAQLRPTYRLYDPTGEGTAHTATAAGSAYGELTVTGVTSESSNPSGLTRYKLTVALDGVPAGVDAPAGSTPFAQGDEVMLVDCGIDEAMLVDEVRDASLFGHVETSASPSLGSAPRVVGTGKMRSHWLLLRDRITAVRWSRRGDVVTFWAGWTKLGEVTLSGLPAGPTDGVTTELFGPADARASGANTVLLAAEAPAGTPDDDDWRDWAASKTVRWCSGRAEVGTYCSFPDADDCAALVDRRRRWRYGASWAFLRADGSPLHDSTAAHTGQSYSRPEGLVVSQVIPDEGADYAVTARLAITTPPVDAGGSAAGRSVAWKGSWPIRARTAAGAPGWRDLHVAASGGSDTNPGTAGAPLASVAAAAGRAGPMTRILLARGGSFGRLEIPDGAIGPVRAAPYGDPGDPAPVLANSTGGRGPVETGSNVTDVTVEGCHLLGFYSPGEPSPGEPNQPAAIRLGSSNRRVTITNCTASEGRGLYNRTTTNFHRLICFDNLYWRPETSYPSYTVYLSGIRWLAMTRLDTRATITELVHVTRATQIDGLHHANGVMIQDTFTSTVGWSLRNEVTRANVHDLDVMWPDNGVGAIMTEVLSSGAGDGWPRTTAAGHGRFARIRTASNGTLQTPGHDVSYEHNIGGTFNLFADSGGDPRQPYASDCLFAANRRHASSWSLSNSDAATNHAPTSGALANRGSTGTLQAPGAPAVVASGPDGLILAAQGVPAGGVGFIRLKWWRRPAGGGEKTYLDGFGSILMFEPAPEAGSWEYGVDAVDGAGTEAAGDPAGTVP